MWIIAGRELRSLLSSPLGWSVLAVVQFILACVFAVLLYALTTPEIQAQLASHNEAPSVSELILDPWFNWVGVLLLMITPLLTMRLISEERRNRTLNLLLSAALPIWQIMLGKFLGVFGFLCLLLAVLLLMPLSLLLGTALDLQQLAIATIGALLLAASFTAIGLYISTLSAQPFVAAITTFGVLLLLWMIDWTVEADAQFNVLGYLSLLSHYQRLVQGFVSSTDVIYYGLLTAVCLILSIHRLDQERIY